MKTESHDPTEGRERSETEDNVVRLPREWLGPREELVQIGVVDTEAVAAPPAPEDFWGEGSSELQSALVGAPGVPPRADPDRSGAQKRPFAGPSVAPRRSDQSRYYRLARTPAVIAAATAALIFAVVVISALGGQRARPSQVASLLHRQGSLKIGSGSASSKAVQMDARHLFLKLSRAHRVRRHVHARASKGRAASPATPTSPAVIASSTPTTTYNEASSVSSGASQTVSSSTAQAASAQPTQPAFGANGALGPGHGASNTQ